MRSVVHHFHLSDLKATGRVFYGILPFMSELVLPDRRTFARLYARFQAPIAAFDCGSKCAPYNENHRPFCCDTGHMVPTAYTAEWEHLQAVTAMWHPWEAEEPEETARLQAETPPGQVLIECQGHTRCQREHRALTCRAFPFFPYIDGTGEFIGLSYYWEYEDRCWVANNLQVVTPEFRIQFCAAYDELFALMPGEYENFRAHSEEMRRVFTRRRRAIPLIHREGGVYKLSPVTGRLRRANPESLPKFGPYRIAALLPFPDELADG